ncbi:hypothetical protein CGCF413_v007242 [Colletotrichum fructicola]|nr:hypothetical protein CFRS1_v003551 [Colletotrichum fructicola]KAF5499695.1 hypothetical protein CGCF413_v007242 [Colletotrichum fructicola]
MKYGHIIILAVSLVAPAMADWCNYGTSNPAPQGQDCGPGYYFYCCGDQPSDDRPIWRGDCSSPPFHDGCGAGAVVSCCS